MLSTATSREEFLTVTHGPSYPSVTFASSCVARPQEAYSTASN